MSDELKYKLLAFEADPPELTWNKIAASLEEEVTAEFPNKLYALEVEPPANTWSKIAVLLEKDAVQYPTSLYNLEVEPPKGVWSRIASALTVERSIPQRAKVISLARWAVAAAVTGILIFLGIRVFDNGNEGRIAVDNSQTPNKTIQQPVQQKVADTSTTAVALSNNLPKERVAKKNAEHRSPGNNLRSGPHKTEAPESLNYMTETVDGEPYSAAVFSNVRNASLTGPVPGSNAVIANLDRYFTFINPEGSLVRISKKLAETLGCVYPNNTSEQYRNCQEQLEKWRQKIAQMPVNPSTDNFMGIIDLLKTTQENDQL